MVALLDTQAFFDFLKLPYPSSRERFGLPESKVATVSTLIALTKDLELIKADESETLSTRYAKYVPFWAN